MTTTDILLPEWAQTDYFAMLSAARPVAAVIAEQLEPYAPSGAKSLRCCGRYGISVDPIELVSGPRGLFVRGVKWCSSRFCPTCQPRIMATLGTQRAARARAAEVAGFGIAFARFSQPRGETGELLTMLEAQQADWRTAFPSPSRLPAAWKDAGLSDWLSMDYNIEVDWDAVAENWHVHAHALPWRRSPWCESSRAFLGERWPHPEPLAWIEDVEKPEAAARYSVKAQNDDPQILGLFELAQRGMVAQVAEYLHAVQGRRLRASSLALTKALGLGGPVEDDQALLALAEASPGEVVERLTVTEWRQRW